MKTYGGPYNARRHEQALLAHGRRWHEMRATRLREGSDSDAYREARQLMIEAWRVVVSESRRRKRRAA